MLSPAAGCGRFAQRAVSRPVSVCARRARGPARNGAVTRLSTFETLLRGETAEKLVNKLLTGLAAEVFGPLGTERRSD